MDILSARKKAAERALVKKPAGTAPSPATPSDKVAEIPRAAEVAVAAVPATPLPSAPEAKTETSREGEPGEATTAEIEMLSFRLSGEGYAVMVEDVREVLKVRDLTQIPNAPDYMLGVMSLRGTMLTVIDLSKRLGLRTSDREDKARIIVVSPDDEDVGLVVDGVTGVIKIMPNAIKPAPEHVEQGEEFLRGIVRQGERLYIVLDLKKTAG